MKNKKQEAYKKPQNKANQPTKLKQLLLGKCAERTKIDSRSALQ